MLKDYYSQFLATLDDEDFTRNSAYKKKFVTHSKGFIDGIMELDMVSDQDVIKKKLELLVSIFQKARDSTRSTHNSLYAKNFKKSINQLLCNRIHYDKKCYDKSEFAALNHLRKTQKAELVKNFTNKNFFESGKILNSLVS